VVEAEQFLPGDGVQQGDRFEALGFGFMIHFDAEGAEGPCLLLDTGAGVARADYGDWILVDRNGRFYPCKNEIFEATYEAVAADELAQPVPK